MQEKLKILENSPELWQSALLWPKPSDNKYSRGHLLVCGGAPHQTGASRMAAMAGLRTGAGAVTIASPEESLATYAAHLTAIMIAPVQNSRDLKKLIAEKHISGIVTGPGNGVNQRPYEFTLAAIESGLPTVIDADAITVFSGKYQGGAQELFGLIKNKKAKTVMTPHEGEFTRLFGSLSGNKAEQAMAAAKISGAVILLKGSDTAIAAPEGRIVINKNAPAALATAGSGDVLSGIIGGLVSGGMDIFQAACAGTWIHSEAARLFGPGLIAEDLPGLIRKSCGS